MEVIEITEREIEIIEVIERGPIGQTGPQPDINYTVVSSARTLEAADLIAADTSGGAFALTLPANPSDGDAVDIFDFSETFDTNPLTIARNGSRIESLEENLVCNVEGAYFTLIYTGSTRGWQVVPRFGTSGGGGESTLTTQGDMLYRGAAVNTRLGIGTAGQILKVNSSATAPEWGEAPATGVTSVSGTAPIASSGGATPTISITAATTSAAGSMSSADKTKLDAITGTNTGDQTITLTGNVTGSGTGSFAATIANDAVDNTKLSNMAQSTLKGRATASTGDPEDLSASQVRTILNVADGATANTASTATPSALGTAAAGSGTAYAREDHVHSADLADSAFRVVGSSDATKKVAFEVDSLTTATTRTLTVPDANITLDDSGDTRDPNAHAASHAAAGSDPVFDQDLNTADAVEFGTVVITGTLDASAAGNTFLAPINLSIALVDTASTFFGTLRVEADSLTANRTYDLPDASGTLALTTTAPASHAHGNLTNDGKVGSDSGRVLVTTTAGAVTTLALGTAGQVLTVNSGASGVEFAAAAGGGVTTGSVDNAIIRADGTGGSTSQSSDLVIDDAVVPYAITGDASTDIITAVGHNYTANQAVRFQVLTGGSGLNNTTTYFVRDISGNTFKVSTSSGGAAVNFTTNITSGSIVATQPSVAIHTQRAIFTITADASTDVITATAHTFVDGDSVTFSNLVGGAGLDTITRYFVRDISGDTFKVSTAAGGAATNITTNYTGGTVELGVAIVIGGNRLGAVIVGSKPDGTTLGGNARGSGAVDLLQLRTAATHVASGTNAFLAGGRNNTASGLDSVVLGGNGNTASAYLSAVLGSAQSSATGQGGVVLAGSNASATNNEGCLAIGTRALADRAQIIAQAGGFFVATGDAQRIHAVLRGKTTSNTAVELLTGISINQRLTIPSGKVMAGIINCVGVKSDGTAVAHYVREFSAKNVAGTSSLVGSVTTIGADTEDNASTDISVTVSDANDALTISVTGIASETWRWVASVDAVECSYGT